MTAGEKIGWEVHFNHELLKGLQSSAEYIQVIISFQISEFMTGPSLLAHSNLVTENQPRSSNARKQGLKLQNTKIMPKISEETETTTVVSGKIEFSWNAWKLKHVVKSIRTPCHTNFCYCIGSLEKLNWQECFIRVILVPHFTSGIHNAERDGWGIHQVATNCSGYVNRTDHFSPASGKLWRIYIGEI